MSDHTTGLTVVPYLDTPGKPTVEIHDSSGEVLIALDSVGGRALAGDLVAACDHAERMGSHHVAPAAFGTFGYAAIADFLSQGTGQALSAAVVERALADAEAGGDRG